MIHNWQPACLIITVLLLFNACQHEPIECSVELTIPTAFAPDGSLDHKVLKMQISHAQSWEASIYNRWGQVIYQSRNDSVLWDGTVKDTDSLSHIGTYVYHLTGKNKCGQPFERRGNVILVY